MEKTHIDLVSFSGADLQLPAKNRETAFGSRLEEQTPQTTLWPAINTLAQTLCQPLICSAQI